MGHTERVPKIDIVSTRTEAPCMPYTKKIAPPASFVWYTSFVASAKSDTGTSLNYHLLVGSTIQLPLVDVLLRFRQFKVALTTDFSRTYRAVHLPDNQKDLHRFLRREDPEEPILKYKTTR